MPDPQMPDMQVLQQSLQDMANKAAAPEKSEPGPGDVQPSAETKGAKPGDPAVLVTLKMTPDEVGAWWTRVKDATARTEAHAKDWDILLKEYLPHVAASGTAETVKYNGHFRNVHSKIGQLFYRAPDLIMSARDPGPGNNQQPAPVPLTPGPDGQMMPTPPITLDDIIAVKQQVLQFHLGREGVKVTRLMDELLFDVLAWAGIGCSKLGYRCVMKTVQVPVMGPPPPPPGGMAPLPELGNPLGLGGQVAPQQPVPQMDAMGQPLMQNQEVPIWEDYYWRRFSPKKLITNTDLRSSRFDEDATWMGMHFYLSPKKAKAMFGLTDDEVSKATQDEQIFKHKEDEETGKNTVGLVHGVEISLKASVFTDEVHPQAMNQLVLIEGLTEKPVVWRPSPDQEFETAGPRIGQLTHNSLIGFPYRVLTIRDLADSPFPKSDSAFTNSQIKQIGTYRKQGVKLRDAAIGKFLFDGGAFDEEDIALLKSGEVGEFIEVMEGKLALGQDKILVRTPQVVGSADDYRNEELLKRDVDETLGIGSNQSGSPENTVRTATETATVQAAVSARNDKELGRVVDFYLDGARMLDSLLMRYADNTEYVQIAGEAGAVRIMVWNNKIISGRYIYDIAPDSQMRVDTARSFDKLLKFYTIAAQDPLCNRAYLLKRLARMNELDPAKVVASPAQMMMQPPHGGGDVAHTLSNSGKRPNEPGAENHRGATPTPAQPIPGPTAVPPKPGAAPVAGARA